jgi:hypothetical protein
MMILVKFRRRVIQHHLEQNSFKDSSTFVFVVVQADILSTSGAKKRLINIELASIDVYNTNRFHEKFLEATRVLVAGEANDSVSGLPGHLDHQILSSRVCYSL